MTRRITDDDLNQFAAALTAEAEIREGVTPDLAHQVVQDATVERFGEHYGDASAIVFSGRDTDPASLRALINDDDELIAVLTEILDQIGD